MALTAYLTDTTKRVNSTAAVPITGATQLSILLKDDTDIVRPTFDIDMGSAWNPSSYNYIKVTDFDRGYFIDKWYFSGGLWHCSCVCDVLASFKSEILLETKYVLRTSDNTKASAYTADYLYPVTEHTSHNYIGSAFGWVRSFVTGYYVVGVIGGGGSAGISSGSVTYLVMTYSQLGDLVKCMLQGMSTDWTDGNAIKNNITRAIADPLQYIVSILYFPVQPPTSLVSIPIQFGFWQATDQSGNPLTAPLLSDPVDTVYYGYDISNYTGYSTWGDPYSWAYMEPFNSYILMINPWGTFPIPSNLIAGKKNLGFEVRFDFVSGLAMCNVYAHDGNLPTSFSRTDNLLVSREAQVGTQIQLTNNTSSILTAISNTISGTTSGAGLGGAIAGAVGAVVGGLASGIVNAVGSVASRFESTGSVGGISGNEGMPSLHIYHKHNAQPLDISELGTTCSKNYTLSSLTGYVQCADGNNSVNALKEEKDMIAEFMTSGFYIE